MALPTVAQVKAVLRIQHTAEDTLLQGMLDRACALIVAHMGRPYEAEERTWIDEGGRVRAYGGLTSLTIPTGPIDPTTLVIEDADGEILVAATDYRAPVATDGVIRAARGTTFANAPYTLTADVGLSARADYATLVEPVLSQAVIDCVSDWWARRNPNATSETTGGGVSTSWLTEGLPPRVCMALSSFTAPRVV